MDFKKFLLENWSKIILAVFLTILLILLAQVIQNLNDMLNAKERNYITDTSLMREREKRLEESEMFDRKVKCQNMVSEFKDRYNNVTGGSYNTRFNTCDIEYRDGNEKETSQMEFMSDN